MKIAWCFSGQVRVGVECSENILRFIGDCDVDFFIHTWDIETDKLNNNFRTVANTEKINNFLQIYKPKKSRIDNFDKYQSENVNYLIPTFYPLFNFPMFHSIYESNRLKEEKEEYEKENNFKYDYVVRARPDIIYGEFDSLKEEISYIDEKDEFFQTGIDNIVSKFDCLYVSDDFNKLPHAIEDVFWISKSGIMDQICNFKQWGMHYSEFKYQDYQILLYKYVTDALKFNVKSLKYNNTCTVRYHDLIPNNFIKQNFTLI